MAGDSWTLAFQFRVADVGGTPSAPLVLGLFQSAQLVDRHSLTLQIRGGRDVRVAVAGAERTQVVQLPGELQAGRPCHITFEYAGHSRTLAWKWRSERAAVGQPPVDSMNGSLIVEPTVRLGGCDEVGVAQWELEAPLTPREGGPRIEITRVEFVRVRP